MYLALKKVLELPETIESNTLYFVKSDKNVKMFMSDSEGTELLPIAGYGQAGTFIDADGTVYNDVIRVKRTVIADKGKWTVDYSDVGFSKVLAVIPVGVTTGNKPEDRNFPCMSSSNFDTQSASGKLANATSGGLIVNSMTNGSGPVDVYIDGII